MKKQTPSPRYFTDRLISTLAIKAGLSMSIAALIFGISAGQTFGAVAPKLLDPQFIDSSEISNLHMVGGKKKQRKARRKARKFPDSKVLKTVPKRGKSRSNELSPSDQRILEMFDEMDQSIQDAVEQILRQNQANRNGRDTNSKTKPRGKGKGRGGNSRNTDKNEGNKDKPGRSRPSARDGGSSGSGGGSDRSSSERSQNPHPPKRESPTRNPHPPKRESPTRNPHPPKHEAPTRNPHL